MDNLSDDMLLGIFYYLSAKTLIQLSRVCRRWRRLVEDRSLWTHIALRRGKTKISTWKKVIKTFLGSHTTHAYLSNKSARQYKFEFIGRTQLLPTLFAQCPNLVSLTLEFWNLRIDLLCPALEKLKELRIIDCQITYLGYDIATVGPAPNLRTLDIKNTYVNDELSKMWLNSPHLEKLSMWAEITFTPQAVERDDYMHIARNLTAIEMRWGIWHLDEESCYFYSLLKNMDRVERLDIDGTEFMGSESKTGVVQRLAEWTDIWTKYLPNLKIVKASYVTFAMGKKSDISGDEIRNMFMSAISRCRPDIKFYESPSVFRDYDEYPHKREDKNSLVASFCPYDWYENF